MHANKQLVKRPYNKVLPLFCVLKMNKGLMGLEQHEDE